MMTGAESAPVFLLIRTGQSVPFLARAPGASPITKCPGRAYNRIPLTTSDPMRSVLTAVLGATLLVAPLSAQGMRGRRQGMRAPDHWMTLDSVMTALSVTDKEKPTVQQQYGQIDSLMKVAVGERQKMREQFQAGGGPPSPEQRQAMRAKMDGLQKQLDDAYKALRDALSPDQQKQLDALPKPMVAFRRRNR